MTRRQLKKARPHMFWTRKLARKAWKGYRAVRGEAGSWGPKPPVEYRPKPYDRPCFGRDMARVWRAREGLK